MRKVIGITSSQENQNIPMEYTLPKAYIEAIAAAGALPVILPIIDKDVDLINQMVQHVDGILFTGGVDIDPLLFGEQPVQDMGRIDPDRDFFEIHLAKAAFTKDLPVLGICRGCQLLNTVAGGTLIQDIPSAFGKDNIIKHSQSAPRYYPTHTARIIPGSKLEKIFGTQELTINSYHHQAIKTVAPGFQVSAQAPDGVIEAIEGVNHRFAIGVQWHPEHMWYRHPIFSKLFKNFVDNC